MKKKLIIVLVIIIVLLSSVLIYSKNVTTHNLKVIEYSIIDEKLPDKFHGFKIVQFSDVLYGKSTSIKDIENVVKEINKLKPDIVVFTGDFLSKNIKITEKEKEKIKEVLSNINSKYDKYAIYGDNDQAFKDTFYQIFNDNFIILDNEKNKLYISNESPILITGLTDITKEEIIPDEEKNIYNILLLHKPDEVEKLKNKYNIVLSGHSMGGQIKFPFYGPLIKLDGAKKYLSGPYTINDTKLYVNDGIGSQNINMRINNNPKINFYRLYKY